MIKIIHGKNTIVSKMYLDKVRDSFKDKKISEIDIEDNRGWNLLSNELRIEGLFGGNDLIIVKNFFSGEEAEISKKDICELLKDYRSDVCFMEYKELKKTDLSFFKKIDNVQEKKNDLFDLKKNKREIVSFLNKYAMSKGYTIDRQVVDGLIDGYKEIGAILCEIDKLGTYDPCISMESFNKLSIIPFESDLFKFIETIALKNKKESYYLLEKEKNKGTVFDLIFAMIVYQFRNLIIVKEAEIKGTGNPGLSGFVFNKLRYAAKNMSVKELKKYYFQLFKYDKLVKRGEMKSIYAMECFIKDIR
ncbi:MAG: hypothetical protein PHO23_00545 [Candidatus Pacebacteria bacterium]|nr:hypothetical protein [Candidatus Paceibacterota bacterium]